MSIGTVILLTILYGLLVLLVQRAERKRRLLVAVIRVPIGVSIHWYANIRSVGSESTTAIIAALILNFLFWVVIGRYNPVGSSDDIQVIGLDD